MKIVIDMNLSPDWQEVLQKSGHTAVHWSRVGARDATDQQTLEWAKAAGHVVFTHDLDFSAILAATGSGSPSVLQVRAQDVAPLPLGALLLTVIKRFEDELTAGAIVTAPVIGDLETTLPRRFTRESATVPKRRSNSTAAVSAIRDER